MTTLTANQIALAESTVAAEIKALRAEIADRAEIIATLAQNGVLTAKERGKVSTVRALAEMDAQIAAWRAAFNAEIATATAQEIAAAKALCVECNITTEWF